MSVVEQTVAIVDEVIEATERKARDESLPLEVRQHFNVIAQVATYHFREDNTHEPFAPMVQTSEGRSLIPADLSDEDLARCKTLPTRGLIKPRP